MRILVIADDITGAAEMAGVARRMGCRVGFSTQPRPFTGDEEVMVWATDTRSMGRKEAVETTESLLEAVRRSGEVRLFKKTDSVLRGHVAAEFEVLMRLGYERALLLPANPSKGRCIVDGIYTIEGTPIAETVFRTDPEFPARCSEVEGLVGSGARHVTNPAEPLQRGISIGESGSEEAVAEWIVASDPSVLLAGAADAFKALLMTEGHREATLDPFAGLGDRPTFIALGSTVRHDLSHEPFFLRNRVAERPMPDAVFEGGSSEEWIASCCRAEEASLLVKIPQQVKIDGEKALYLRRTMARCVAEAVQSRRPEELIIEGGASAYAILEELGWSAFTVADEIAPGVVRLRHTESGTHLTFKPGSYPWGAMFQ